MAVSSADGNHPLANEGATDNTRESFIESFAAESAIVAATPSEESTIECASTSVQPSTGQFTHPHAVQRRQTDGLERVAAIVVVVTKAELAAIAVADND